MFRFTIRDVLWLTVVTALVVGWFIDRNQLARQISVLDSDISKVKELLKQSEADREHAYNLLDHLPGGGHFPLPGQFD